MMRVPLVKPDLPAFEAVEGAFREILGNGKITNFGKYVSAFEAAVSGYLGVDVVTVSSGTVGLLFALQALGIEKGAKVIVPSFTFTATVQAIRYAGGMPVFAEIGDDMNLSPEDLEGLLARHPDAAAVLGVHAYGLPCQVDRIAAIVDAAARRTNRRIPVIYDAAHALGSSVAGRKVGGFGDAEIFSLSVTKALVSVEGGMVASRDRALIARLRGMRNYGIESNYDALLPGLNGKMSEFHAIVGLENLKLLEGRLAARQERARAYGGRIESRTGFRMLPCPAGVVHTWKDFTVMLPASLHGRRERLMARLKERGVETRAYFHPPVHEQGLFRSLADRPLPRTEALARSVITLPFFTSITDAEIDHVVGALAEGEKASA